MDVESNALKEWALENKGKMISVILLVSIVLMLGWVLYGSLKHCFFIEQKIESIKQKILQKKAMNLERQVFFQETYSKILSYKKQRGSEDGIKPAAIGLSYYLSQCGVWQFNFTEESRVPLGGQGKPIFSLMADLYYSQALCVLDCFYRYSLDKKLRIMKLEQKNNDPRLTLTMEMEVMR